MTFGQPMVLFPAVGAIVIGGGPVTAGLLLASFAVGGILSSLVSGRVTGLRWQGGAIRNAIVCDGLAITGLGVVLAWVTLGGHAVASMDFADVNRPALGPAAVGLAVAGGSDNISSIFRQTILQTAVPDHLRGRTQGVFTVVVTGGPRLGQTFAGTLATLTATWVPALVGGVLVVVLVWVTVARVPSFRDYDGPESAAMTMPLAPRRHDGALRSRRPGSVARSLAHRLPPQAHDTRVVSIRPNGLPTATVHIGCRSSPTHVGVCTTEPQATFSSVVLAVAIGGLRSPHGRPC